MIIDNMKRFLKKHQFTNDLYNRAYHVKYLIQKQRTIKILKTNGKQIISQLQSILEQSGTIFFFDMGTLLGFIREGGILGHDLDIDIGVLSNNEEKKQHLRKYLVSKGCKLRFHYYVDELGTIEDSFMLHGIKFDINYYFRKRKQDICYLMFQDEKKQYSENTFDVVMLSTPTIENIVLFNVLGTKVNIPVNAETYLANRYGNNWRIPDTNYIYWKGPSAHKTNYIGKRKVYE